jgi:hypothetical protein
MKTLNKKPLFLAIAGVTAFGAVGMAQAVSVNPTGLGQVLVYPYYTVKGAAVAPFNTLLSIVNTTNSTKAVKVRFREGKASKEVLDFNIFLSPEDVWTGWLEPSASGGVKLGTADKTCTLPAIPAAGVEFRNGDYKGDAAEDDTLTRLREGYFEVFEMSTYTASSTTAKSAKHTSAGVPAACAAITNALALSEAQAPNGGLSGTASLVAPGVGINASMDATALVNFKAAAFYQNTGTEKPNFADADQVSVTATANGNSVWASWSFGDDAVTAALDKASIINEFVLDAATKSATDWVVTFPTKHHYVIEDVDVFHPFKSVLGPTGSCDNVSLTLWNREEGGVTPAGPDFSPSPSPEGASLCWEANIVTFNGKNVFGSSNTLSVATTFESGWAQIGFQGSSVWNGTGNSVVASLPLAANSASLVTQNGLSVPSVSSLSNTTFSGLPAIGFAVQTFPTSPLQSYAGTFAHRFVPGTP